MWPFPLLQVDRLLKVTGTEGYIFQMFLVKEEEEEEEKQTDWQELLCASMM